MKICNGIYTEGRNEYYKLIDILNMETGQVLTIDLYYRYGHDINGRFCRCATSDKVYFQAFERNNFRQDLKIKIGKTLYQLQRKPYFRAVE